MRVGYAVEEWSVAMFDTYPADLKNDLALRWRRVRLSISEAGADGLLVASNVNIFYLSGRVFMGYIYLPVEGNPLFLVRRPSGMRGERVSALGKPEEILARLSDYGIAPPARLMLEGDDLPFSEWTRLSLCFKEATLINGSTLLRHCRAIKTPYEEMLMCRTGRRHAEVVAGFPALYKPGMTDQEWAVEMYHLMLRSGSLGLFRIAGRTMEAFMGTVLAGDNGGAVSPYDFALGGRGLSDSLPVGQCGMELQPGMAVMADVAANFHGYMTDCTRTFAIGRTSPMAEKAHQVSIEIVSELTAALTPGAHCADLHTLAMERAERAGLADFFMGLERKARFVGHGTGIVINELPVISARSTDILKAGMCIALEPKFVIPGAGAVGIEDTVLVTERGGINLTPCSTALVEV